MRQIQSNITHAAERNRQGWGKRICGVGVDVKRNVVTVTSYTGYAPVGFWGKFEGRFPRRAVDFEKGCPNEGVDAS